jgi:hypothetical protein
MDKYVLDTNLFFNMEPGLGIGGKTADVLTAATKGFIKLKSNKNTAFLMKSFFGEETAVLKNFMAEITVKSPNISKTTFPASVFYELVKEIKDRLDRGLDVAEDELFKAVSSLAPVELKNKQEVQMKAGVFTKSLRDRYRQLTRTRFLDSVADLDLIVLAKEEDAYLVSTDEGAISWGRKFGVKEIDPEVFGKKIKDSA